MKIYTSMRQLSTGSQRASDFLHWFKSSCPAFLNATPLFDSATLAQNKVQLPFACWLGLVASVIQRHHSGQCNDQRRKEGRRSAEGVLTSHCTLLDEHLLAGALGGRGLESRASHRGVGESVSRHVFAVRFPDDPKGARVGVRYVSDGVPVQRRLVGDGTYLLHGQLGAGLGLGWERRLEGLVVAEGDVGAGAEASGGLLGERGGVLGRRLGDVLVQPSSWNRTAC